MTKVLLTATQAAPYSPIATNVGVATASASTSSTPNTASGKNSSQAAGKNASQATGKNPTSQTATGKNTNTARSNDSGGQSPITINAGSTGMSSGWFWGFAILFSAIVGFGIWYFSKRKK